VSKLISAGFTPETQSHRWRISMPELVCGRGRAGLAGARSGLFWEDLQTP
jgi:hypothetical protein